MAVDHQLIEGTVAAYVLDACDDGDEAERVRAHLEACVQCRELAARLREAAEVLPLSVELVPPPAHLRARLAAAAAAVTLPRPVGGAPGEARAGGTLMTARRRVLFPMGAAAAAAVVGVGASALLAWNAAHQPPVRFALSGTGTMAGASGDVTTLPSGGGALISLTGLPELAPGQVYELWLFDGSGRAVPAGVFKPGAGGSATVAVRRPLAAVRQVAVTAEAGPRGTQVPTVKPELGGSAP